MGFQHVWRISQVMITVQPPQNKQLLLSKLHRYKLQTKGYVIHIYITNWNRTFSVKHILAPFMAYLKNQQFKTNLRSQNMCVGS